MLRQGTATVTLKRGVMLRGRVTDPAGKPIKDAFIVSGDDPYLTSETSKFPTDADGQFRLPPLAPGEKTLTVLAPGWAPQLRKVSLQAGLAAAGLPHGSRQVDPVADRRCSRQANPQGLRRRRRVEGRQFASIPSTPASPRCPTPKSPAKPTRTACGNGPRRLTTPVKLTSGRRVSLPQSWNSPAVPSAR